MFRIYEKLSDIREIFLNILPQVMKLKEMIGPKELIPEFDHRNQIYII